MRPVLVALLLVVDAFAVVSLAIAHPHGWLPPFIAFGSLCWGWSGSRVGRCAIAVTTIEAATPDNGGGNYCNRAL
jgi:hypothetical protein